MLLHILMLQMLSQYLLHLMQLQLVLVVWVVLFKELLLLMEVTQYLDILQL